MASSDDVQLPDLHVIQRYSLAVRGATAPRADVVAALQADLAWLTGASRRSSTTAREPESAKPPVAKAAPRSTQPAPRPLPAKKSAPAPAKKSAPAVAKKSAPAPAKKSVPVKKSAPAKRAPAKKGAPAKKSAPSRKPTAVKKSPPVKKSGPATKPPVKAAKKRRPKPRGARWA